MCGHVACDCDCDTGSGNGSELQSVKYKLALSAGKLDANAYDMK
jgi:hypothetical protein